MPLFDDLHHLEHDLNRVTMERDMAIGIACAALELPPGADAQLRAKIAAEAAKVLAGKPKPALRIVQHSDAGERAN